MTFHYCDVCGSQLRLVEETSTRNGYTSVSRSLRCPRCGVSFPLRPEIRIPTITKEAT